MTSTRPTNRGCRRLGSVLLTLLACTAAAHGQFNVPFQVTSGDGTLDEFPSLMNPESDHSISSGTALLGGNPLNYSGTGRVRLLGPPDPATAIAPFESADPFLFDFGSDGSLEMHYGRVDFGAPTTGFVQVPVLPNGLVDTEWVAVFTPVPGSGTGQFANVVGGAFFMIAEADPFDPTATNIPYRWSSGDVGFLTFVPEPHGLLLLAPILLWMIRRLR